MRIRAKQFNQKGYTLIELAVATAVMAVLATTVIVANQFMNKQAVANADRTFATEKAIQMYEELRALVGGNEQLGIGVLQNYSNGSLYDAVLTTDENVDTGTHGGAAGNPADPLSGNLRTPGGNWRYLRQVEVDPVANDTQAKQVTVKVYQWPGDFSAAQTIGGTLMATVGGILRTSAEPNVPTQVMDIYILQIDNIPSWWSVLPTLADNMQGAVADLQSRLQGMQLRVHYITRTSYGRDSQYQPETNSAANPSESTHQQWVYFYPGISEEDSPNPDGWYFDPQTSDPNSVLMDGNFMVDGTSYPVSTSQFTSDTETLNVSYSVADQYNNAMRYPDEMAEYAAVTSQMSAFVAQGGSPQEGATEISERMLFENMLSEPASFQNAIIVNLHGELLPLPPLRNYSDAAKDPGNQLASCPVTGAIAVTCAIPAANGVSGDTNVRVVTHPELLYYPLNPSPVIAGAVTVRLRVYAYYDSEDVGGAAGLPVSTTDPRVPAISLFFPDDAVTLVNAVGEIGNGLTGGVPYARVTLTAPGAIAGDTSATGPMSFTTAYVGPGSKQTLITLYKTPLRCPAGPVSGGSGSATVGGLNIGDMLYGSEYIPCSPDITTSGAPVSNNTNLTATTYENNTYTFTNQDLANPGPKGAGQPNNTARWIISVVMPVTQAYTNPITILNQPFPDAVTYSSGTTFVGQHAIETRLGNAVTSSIFLNNVNVPVTVQPNLSRTYVWTGATMPPYTEQYQFMGDPRDCPYFDVKVGGVSVSGAQVTIGPNAYNWWFKGTDTAGMASDGYSGFAQAGANNFSMSNGGSTTGYVNLDLPRYYQLIRRGLLNTTSIWTGTNGWSWYYYGVGGEYGSNQSPRSDGVYMKPDLYSKTYSAGAAAVGYDNLSVWYNATFTGQVVAANITTGQAGQAVTWYQRSWLGEIYPDKSYNNWVSYGNLPSVANTTIPSGVASKPDTFYLEPMQNVQTAGPSGSSDDGFEGDTMLPNPGGNGCESFYDGKNTGTGDPFAHAGGPENVNGDALNLAVTTYNVYPFPLPALMEVDRQWSFTGGEPPEAAIAPYNTAPMTTQLTVPSVNGTSRIFFDYNGTGATSPYGSGVVKMTQINTVPATPVTQVGYVVESGTAPSGDVGVQTLAETALVEGMRTFLDGGQMAATNVVGHIAQIPLVKIFLAQAVPEYNESQTIAFTVASPVTMTSATTGAGAMTVGQPVTDIWWRFNPNGLASFYTEEYPQPTPSGAMTAQSGLYTEAVSVIYNLKYSSNGGASWLFVQDNSAAVTGVCDCNVANGYASIGNPNGHAVTYVAPWTYNWPVASGGTTLAQGVYQLMVEAYRQGYGLHYAYDTQYLQVSW